MKCYETFLALSCYHCFIIQWETVEDQVANIINNLPFATRYVAQDVEHLDLLTPNRLLLARNNDRCYAVPVNVSENIDKKVQQHKDLYVAWFSAWIISFVPSLMFQPKWFNFNHDRNIGDIFTFLISDLKVSCDEKIRQVEIELFWEYQEENDKGIRELVVIHPFDELDVVRKLNMTYHLSNWYQR